MNELDKFCDEQDKIYRTLNKLIESAEDHFGRSPDCINKSDIATLKAVGELLDLALKMLK